MINRACVALAALAMCLVTSTAVANAADTLPCVTKWGGPQTNSSAINSCKDVDPYVDFLQHRVAAIVFPLLLGLVGIFAMPFVFCARYCCGCCGGHKQRPGDCCCGSPHWDTEAPEMVMAQYSDCDRSCAAFFPLALVLFALIFVAVCVAGSAHSVKGIDGISVGIHNVVNYLRAVVTNFVADTENPVTGVQLMSMDNFTSFTDSLDDVIEGLNNKSTQDAFTLSKNIAGNLAQATAAPALIVFLTLLCALAKLRTCLPCLNAFCSFLFMFVFGFVGCIILAIHLPLDIVCNEVNFQLERKPGLGQWYFVPRCQKHNLFAKIHDKMDDQVADSADSACTAMKDFCGPRGSTNATQQFTCDYTILFAGTCSTFDEVEKFSNSMELKTAALAATVCGGNTNCSLCVCGNHCNDAKLKKDSHDACTNLENAKIVFDAYDTHLKPILNCNVIMDQLVLVAKPMCDYLPKGLYMLGVGYTIITLVALMTICINFRGQKRWFKKPTGYTGMVMDPDTQMMTYDSRPEQSGDMYGNQQGQPQQVNNVTHVYGQQQQPGPGQVQQGAYQEYKDPAPVPVEGESAPLPTNADDMV